MVYGKPVTPLLQSATAPMFNHTHPNVWINVVTYGCRLGRHSHMFHFHIEQTHTHRPSIAWARAHSRKSYLPTYLRPPRHESYITYLWMTFRLSFLSPSISLTSFPLPIFLKKPTHVHTTPVFLSIIYSFLIISLFCSLPFFLSKFLLCLSLFFRSQPISPKLNSQLHSETFWLIFVRAWLLFNFVVKLHFRFSQKGRYLNLPPTYLGILAPRVGDDSRVSRVTRWFE